MNANLMTKKIEMSQKEAKEAGKLNTEKFNELRNYMAMYPGFEIQIKAPARRKVEFRGSALRGCGGISKPFPLKVVNR